MMRATYASMSRLRVPPERAPELVAAFRRRAHLVDGFSGFVDLQVWQSDRDAGELIMVSRWESRAHFRDSMRSAAHRVSHDRVDPELDAAISLQALEHLHTYEVVAE
jgi:heme-degrading monooxygenase HmoA